MKTKKPGKDDRHVCGTCKHYDSDISYCPLHPEEEKWEEDYCDGDWEEED